MKLWKCLMQWKEIYFTKSTRYCGNEKASLIDRQIISYFQCSFTDQIAFGMVCEFGWAFVFDAASSTLSLSATQRKRYLWNTVRNKEFACECIAANVLELTSGRNVRDLYVDALFVWRRNSRFRFWKTKENTRSQFFHL